MSDKKVKLAAAVVLAGVILAYVPVQAMFIILLLGFLIVPPVLVLAYVFREGVPVIANELRSLAVSGKDFLVVSISKESIILEPQVR